MEVKGAAPVAFEPDGAEDVPHLLSPPWHGDIVDGMTEKGEFPGGDAERGGGGQGDGAVGF